MEALRKKDGFICDMDGVIYHGNRLLPGAADFVRWLTEHNKHYLFLTNSGQYTTKELQQKLGRMGLDVDESHFYTSALATAYFLNSQAPGCSAYVVGEHGILNALYDSGITYNDVNRACLPCPDRSHRVGYRKECVFCREAQSADHADWASDAGCPFGECGHHRGPNGYGYRRWHRVRPGYCPGALRGIHPRDM